MMQKEERNRLEERILAYFDGGLDGEESSALLTEVSSDAEKQSLFNSHETLQRMLSAARTPIETPIETQKSLAERIPGILTYLPHLIGAAETVPILTSSSNSILSLFAKIPLSTAISIGTSVAVVTTVGVVVKNKLDDNAARDAARRSAVVREHIPSTRPLPQFAERSAAEDINTEKVGVVAETSDASTQKAAIGHAASSKLTVRTESHTRDIASANAGGMATKTTASISDHKDVPVNSNSDHKQTVKDIPASNDANPHVSMPANSNLVTNDAEARTHLDARANSTRESSKGAIADASVKPAESADEPQIATIDPRNVTPTPAPKSVSASIVLPRMIAESRSAMFFKPFAAVTAGVVVVPTITNYGQTPESNVRSMYGYKLGVDVPLDANSALRVEAGEQQYVQFGPVQNHYVTRGIEHYVYTSEDRSQMLFWTTVGATYTLDPIAQMPVTFAFGAGTVWTSKISVLGSLSMSTDLSVGDNWVVRPSVNYAAAWIQNSNPTFEGVSKNAMIDHQEFGPSQLLNQSIGVSIGINWRY